MAQPQDPGRRPQPLQEEDTKVSEEGTGTKDGRVCAHIWDHTGSRCFTVALGPCSEAVSCALIRLWEKESAGDFPGEGDGSPLQYSCLENPMALVRATLRSPLGNLLLCQEQRIEKAVLFSRDTRE